PAPSAGGDSVRPGSVPSNGSVANNAATNALEPAPKAGDSTPSDTSVASLPPPAATMQTQPNFGLAPPPPQPNVAPPPTQAQPQVQPNGGDDSSRNGRARNRTARSAEAQAP